MLFLLSPSKTLDFETPLPKLATSVPVFEKETAELIQSLKKMKPDVLKELMGVSDKLAALNAARYKDFNKAPERPALFAFKGDVYAAMEVHSYTPEQLSYASSHLRILSGLYGLLKPLDVIKPHRLEMGTDLVVGKRKNLYEFWRDKLTSQINVELQEGKYNYLINIASNEYFSAVIPSSIKAKVLNVQFKENRDGNVKIIGLFAKQARGLMADFAITHALTKADDLKAFNIRGYAYSAKQSTESEWVFIRKH